LELWATTPDQIRHPVWLRDRGYRPTPRTGGSNGDRYPHDPSAGRIRRLPSPW